MTKQADSVSHPPLTACKAFILCRAFRLAEPPLSYSYLPLSPLKPHALLLLRRALLRMWMQLWLWLCVWMQALPRTGVWLGSCYGGDHKGPALVMAAIAMAIILGQEMLLLLENHHQCVLCWWSEWRKLVPRSSHWPFLLLWTVFAIDGLWCQWNRGDKLPIVFWNWTLPSHDLFSMLWGLVISVSTQVVANQFPMAMLLWIDQVCVISLTLNRKRLQVLYLPCF